MVSSKDFIADNILLLQRLQELGHATSPAQLPLSGSRMQEIPDPLSWSACFLAFIAAKVDQKETRDLAAYGMLILHLARKHTGSG